MALQRLSNTTLEVVNRSLIRQTSSSRCARSFAMVITHASESLVGHALKSSLDDMTTGNTVPSRRLSVPTNWEASVAFVAMGLAT